MVVFPLTKKFKQEFAHVCAPMYFGVSLNVVQCQDFAACAPSAIDNLQSLMNELEGYLQSKISNKKDL